MARDAGVVRDAAGLGGLIDWLTRVEVARGPSLPLTTARLVAEAALARRESRGAHFRADHPAPASLAVHTIQPMTGPGDRRRAA
jgi:L-aspartate oxidase